jgi:Flp pilus assembly pilin Flp
MSDHDFREVVATLPKCEEGQTMAEYGVVLTVIAVTTVVIFTALGDSVEGAIRTAMAFLPG